MEVRDKLSAKLQKSACEKIVGLLFPAVFVCLTDEEISHSVSFHNFPFLLGTVEKEGLGERSVLRKLESSTFR